MSEAEKQGISKAEVGKLEDVAGPVWKDGKPAKATKAQAEAHIRSVKRFCRGELVLPEDERKQYLERFEAAASPEEMEKLHADLSGHHEKIHGNKLNVALGDSGIGTQSQIHRMIFARADDFGMSTPCGQDVNDIMLSEPLDGKAHSKACPRCGTFTTWQPAAFEITD